MKITGLKACALTVTMAFATPAFADATYVGQLQGVATSGHSFIDAGSGCQCLDIADLTGAPVNIDFTATLLDNFTDLNGVTHTNYVSVLSMFVIPNWTFNINTNNIFDPFFITSASYTGNSASATVAGSYFDTGGASSAGFSLTFNGAGLSQGPLSGSGNAYVEHSLNFPVQNIQFGFNLISGNVREITSAVPEPASWALMIAGVGLVGGALRRRTVGARLSFA